MSETTKNILGVQVPIPERDAENALITDYAPLVEIVKQADEDFNQKMIAFFQFGVNDDGLVKASRAWERAGAVLAGYAGTLFNHDANNVDLRQYALELQDKVSKGANIRRKNIRKHCNNKIDTHKDEPETVEKYERIKYEADSSLIRAVNTYERFSDLYHTGGTYELSELKNEVEAAILAEQDRKLLPRDRIHIPGKIYPPLPIPLGEPVPEPPLAFQEYKMAPTEAKVYDPELDELVIKEDWVDPKGLVDSHSVIWDRPNHRVIMRLIGQEVPIIWNEWKATWTGDVMEDGSWEQEYYLRLGQQHRARKVFQLFEPQEYEDDVEILRRKGNK